MLNINQIRFVYPQPLIRVDHFEVSYLIERSR